MPLCRRLLDAVPFTIVLLCCAMARVRTVSADVKDAPLAPVNAAGKLIFEDNFDGTKLDPHWLPSKGNWRVESGELVGSELEADKHAAVLTLKQPNRNSVLKFSFKIDGAKAFNVSFNHARGHLFRVAVRDRALVIVKDKDKRDPKSRPESLAKADAEFLPGRWYTMLVEIDGERVSVRTDNGAQAVANDKRLDVDKTGYRFVTQGASLRIDDLKVWTLDP